MSVISDFKDFAVKGNVVDMAVGVVIGASFGKIVSSLVTDIIMPPIGMLIGGVGFSQLKIVISSQAENQAEVAVRYGVFLQTIFDFLIIAVAIFSVVRMIQRMRRQKQAAPSAPAPPSDEVRLLSEIRDLLKSK